MTTLDEVAAKVSAYGTEQYALGFTAGAADQLSHDQPIMDAQAARIVDLEEQLVPVTVNDLSDFAQQSAGLYLASGPLLGHSAAKTVYRLKAGTSTKKAPTYAGTGTRPTNQLKLIRAGGLSASKPATVEIGDLTVEGTDQPTPYYGGIVVGYGTGSSVHDVVVTGIPGNDSSPPGETFSLAVFHSDSVTLTNVTLDGIRTDDGAQVAATLLGYNYTTGTHVIDNLVANNALYGFGLAMFQCAGSYTFTDCDLRNNRKAINLEQSNGATYVFDRCDFRGTGTVGPQPGVPYVAQVTSINASSSVTFIDPTVASWPLKVNTYSASALSGRNVQKDSDIRLIVSGVDVSKDPTKLQITHL